MTTRRDLYRVVIVTKKPIIRFCKKKYDEHRNCMRHTTKKYDEQPLPGCTPIACKTKCEDGYGRGTGFTCAEPNVCCCIYNASVLA
jgi:hypothetical protein